MRLSHFIPIATLLFLLAASCDNTDDETMNDLTPKSDSFVQLDSTEYPAVITTYVANNFNGVFIVEVYREQYTDGSIRYEVELSNDYELYFDENGNYLGMDDSNTNISNQEVPGAIISYIDANYPDATLVKSEIEIEHGMQVYEITLSNGYELYFDMEGNFLEMDNDDSFINIADVPQNIVDYINNNYPGATILYVEKDTEDGQIVYDVRLSNGVELEFNSSGTLIDTDTYISITDLPQSIIEYIETTYPHNVIDEAEIEFENGQQVYKVKLDNDVELYFDMDGNLLWTEED